MELITIYFIALAWCGLGMVGAQMAYNYFEYTLYNNHQQWCESRDKYGFTIFISAILLGPVLLLLVMVGAEDD